MVTKRYTVHIPRKKDQLLFSNVTNIVEQGEHVLENGDNEFDFEMFIPLDALGSFHHREFGMSFGKNKLTPMGKIPSSITVYWSSFPLTWDQSDLKAGICPGGVFSQMNISFSIIQYSGSPNRH